MPPFMGQGLCSGVRDASNLAWKLDLALHDRAGDGLLDSYTAERRPQCEWIVRLSMEMARVSCVLDETAAADRDAALRGTEAPSPAGLPPLTGGFIRSEDETGLAGAFAVQGTVAAAGGEGFFDDVVGRGFVLLCADGDPRDALPEDQLRFLESLATKFSSLDPAVPSGVRDLDGRLRSWLAESGAVAVIVRPDFHVFGAAASTNEIPALADDLRQQLTTSKEVIHG